MDLLQVLLLAELYFNKDLINLLDFSIFIAPLPDMAIRTKEQRFLADVSLYSLKF
jgi:hypothetical protein